MLAQQPRRRFPVVRLGPSEQDRRDRTVSSVGELTHMCDLYEAPEFKRLLVMERKRTERSGRPFVLVTLDISSLLPQLSGRLLSQAMKTVLRESSREIDIRGWHEEGQVIGVIYTEVTDNGRQAILEKVEGHIAEAFGKTVGALIQVSSIAFPERSTSEKKEDEGTDLALYDDDTTRSVRQRALYASKRAMDVVLSASALVALSPLLMVVAALVKMTSKGPVFFRQERIGMGGEKFHMLKFRSMHVNNDSSEHEKFVKEFIRKSKEGAGEGGEETFKLTNDPRITPVGRFIRKTSIDELPQFVNVLKGEMSLVGPRPPLRYELDAYDAWHRRRVIEVKPGITGVWQVEGRSRTTFDGMVRMDIRYIREQSPWLDLKLLFKTPWAVVTAKGAY